jgi:hypothetical protein
VKKKIRNKEIKRKRRMNEIKRVKTSFTNEGKRKKGETTREHQTPGCGLEERLGCNQGFL